ncbi:hypothetical protein OUZ56_016821 [Daphnia magna]|uniref:Uncharacterized protein n=1 Tax=Daphnia magna TaxID=35525 RepID=A0ABR0ARN2_9CRUS|nr:hypothetical protein OUZ56_016821 [Daphnia magna]
METPIEGERNDVRVELIGAQPAELIPPEIGRSKKSDNGVVFIGRSPIKVTAVVPESCYGTSQKVNRAKVIIHNSLAGSPPEPFPCATSAPSKPRISPPARFAPYARPAEQDLKFLNDKERVELEAVQRVKEKHALAIVIAQRKEKNVALTALYLQQICLLRREKEALEQREEELAKLSAARRLAAKAPEPYVPSQIVTPAVLQIQPLPEVEAQINQRHSVVENNFKEWTKRIRDEMDARERVIIGSLQQDDSLTKQVILESTKAMKKIKEDLLIELRQTRQTEQRETTGTMGNSMEEGATARSRTSSSTSAATTSCETRDELTAERYTLLTKLMGAALVVKSSRDKGERRVNTLKAQTRHERIEEITRKLAEISTAEERVSDHEQLDIALGEMVVLDQLAESQKRDSAPTTTTLVNCLALPLPVFNGEIAAWGSWKAAWSTKSTRLSNTSVLPQW